MPNTEALRQHLLDHAIRYGDFVLKSGATATYFIDVKKTAAHPDGMLLIAEALLEIIPPEVTAIGGLTMGADPVSFSVAAIAATRERKLKAFSIRKEAKHHGSGGRIAGVLEPGDKVVVTEDCVTRGTSPLEAVSVIRDLGAEVVLIAPVVDRGGTCGKMAAEAGIPFHPLLTAPDLGLPYEGGTA